MCIGAWYGIYLSFGSYHKFVPTPRNICSLQTAYNETDIPRYSAQTGTPPPKNIRVFFIKYCAHFVCKRSDRKRRKQALVVHTRILVTLDYQPNKREKNCDRMRAFPKTYAACIGNEA